jgi:hypothetical protein
MLVHFLVICSDDRGSLDVLLIDFYASEHLAGCSTAFVTLTMEQLIIRPLYRTALLGNIASDYVSKATNFART